MLGKINLKKLFHEIKAKFPLLHKQTDTQILVTIYHYLQDNYGNDYNKNDARELQLCIIYNYGFLYR
jgi:hypothetical protein